MAGFSLVNIFVSVLERQKAIMEDGCHHTVVWQRYCRNSLECRPSDLDLSRL